MAEIPDFVAADYYRVVAGHLLGAIQRDWRG
jgi:hypothetical protein